MVADLPGSDSPSLGVRWDRSFCYQTADVVKTMPHDSGVQRTELHADGDASNNSWLMQFQANILAVPVDVPAVTEAMTLGTADRAGLATGFWSNRDEIEAQWRLSRRDEPSMTEPQRNDLYARWLQAVDRSRGWECQTRRPRHDWSGDDA